MIGEEIKNNYYKAMDELENPEGAFLNTDIEDENFKLELSYPRADFIQDVYKSLLKFPESEQMNVTGFFGFVLEQKEEGLTLIGYPSIENLGKDDVISYAKVYHYVKNFIFENEITIKGQPVVSKCLNHITAVFPEFLTLICKTQHRTHSYTVDIHTLKVLQGVMAHPKYKALNKEDKRALQAAVLMHDITKKEGTIDKSHPACSAKDASFILNKFNIPQEQKDKICLLIRNHDWLERYNRGITDSRELAKILKDGNNFLMLCIMAQADLKAVQRGGVFYQKYGEILCEGSKEIAELINILNGTMSVA